ncbi:LysM peptidoglycan-binding domain-containing protein [Caenispirillum salinarum]|uniref:LysM peptidoglycan-binding domain-containing protein n=1 Tax=Caenispirillum salinarum TaxID=859058 RepID=UPI00384E1C87
MTTRVPPSPPRRPHGRRFRILACAALGLALSGCVQWDAAPRYPGYQPAGGAVVDGRVPGQVVVQRGDSVYAIARRYGVPMRRIIEINRLNPPYMLYPGQTLRMPAQEVYRVARGDTLYGISRSFGVNMNTLARVNELRPPYTIYPGQPLVLPGRVETAVAQAGPVPAPRAAQSSGDRRPDPPPLLVDRQRAPETPSTPSTGAAPRPAETQVAEASPPPAPVDTRPPARSGGRFGWPVQGQIISKYGPAGAGLHNDGINIAVPEGTPVRAAENGVVVYSGNELRGFGNLLLLKHDGGWMTAYAHNSKLLVERGATVQRGDVIAHSGQTGNVDRPQVHFEIRKGSKAVDPMAHLDGRGVAMLR